MNARAVFLSVIFLVTLSSCVTGKYKVSKAPPPSTTTVAVEKFATSNYQQLPAGRKGLADFEAIYLPTRLIRALEAHPSVTESYFTLGETPATDFVVKGTVLESDGKDLSVRLILHRVDGAQIWKKTFSYSLSGNTDSTIDKLVNQMWASAAKSVESSRAKTNISLPEARMFAYADNAALTVTDKRVEDARIAGDLERKRILSSLTEKLVPRADVAATYYRNWQKESVPFINQQDQAKRDKAMANFSQSMAVLAAGASAFAGGMAAAQGNTYNYQLAQTNIATASMLAEQAAADAEVASAKIKQLQAELDRLKRDFAAGSGRQITVTIYGQVIKLHGTQLDMMNQFREVVKSKLNEAGVPAEEALAVIDQEIEAAS